MSLGQREATAESHTKASDLLWVCLYAAIIYTHYRH